MTLQPDRLDYKIWKGATFRSTLFLYTDEGTTLRDLTDHTVLMDIKNQAGDEDPLLTLTTENGRVEVGDEEGTITLVISADDTAAITWARGVYDLLLTVPGGDTEALIYGTFKVQDV